MQDNEIKELSGDHVEPSEMDAGYAGAEVAELGSAKEGIRRKPVAASRENSEVGSIASGGVRRKPVPGSDPGAQARFTEEM